MDGEGGGGLDVDGPALVHVDGGDGGLDVLPRVSGCQPLVLLPSRLHLQLAGGAHSKGKDGYKERGKFAREFQPPPSVWSGKFPTFLLP